MKPALGAVAETVAALAVLAWIGGQATLNAFTARTLFHQLPTSLAAPTMTHIFRDFDGLVAVALAVLAAATVTRLWTLGLGGRADRIAAGAAVALVILGVLDVAYIHREIASLYEAGNTLDPRFHALHGAAHRSLHLELVATTLMLGGFAFARRRRPA